MPSRYFSIRSMGESSGSFSGPLGRTSRRTAALISSFAALRSLPLGHFEQIHEVLFQLSPAQVFPDQLSPDQFSDGLFGPVDRRHSDPDLYPIAHAYFQVDVED